MNNITLENYAGAGNGTASDVMMLQKALEAGYTPGTGNSSDNLKVQSLEKTLKNAQYKEKDLSWWMNIPKLPAFSTVEEYNRLESYGDDGAGFFTEGDLPEGVDSLYSRQAEFVKYIGITKSVTHQAQLVSTNVGDLMMHAMMTGTRWVLKKADRALPFANSNIVPEEFNGYLALQRKAYASFALWDTSDNVRDIRGKRLVENDLEDGSEVLVNNYGTANMFITAPAVLSGFTKQYRDSKFIQPNTPAVSNAVMGQRVKQFESQYSTIDFKYDVFMVQVPRFTTSNAQNPKAPAAPVAVSVTPVTDTTNRFLTDYAADYFYGVAAVNKYGESPITALSGSLVTVAATQSVDCVFNAGIGTYAATGYVIYRSEKNPTSALADTKLYPVLSVSVNERAAGFDGGAVNAVREKNRTIPNTFTGVLVENDVDIWSYKQLAPLMSMDVARLGTADRKMILLYGTPQLYMPKKMVLYKNIGRNA